MTGRSRWATVGPDRAVMAVVMAGLRAVKMRTRNAGFVDVCRALGVGIPAAVPPTEANAVASRGGAYRAYRRMTNVLFPGPPRPDPEEAPR